MVHQRGVGETEVVPRPGQSDDDPRSVGGHTLM
jgi:hypothetical protein